MASATGQAADLILVVDDEPGLRELLTVMLERSGYAVLTAADGVEALEVVGSAAADRLALIVLDLHMPAMGGVEFALAYRALPGGQAPIVVMTASDEGASAAARIGAVAALRKPFSLASLLGAVSQALGKAGNPPAAPTLCAAADAG
jgi:CheY-like chemotaxis protein